MHRWYHIFPPIVLFYLMMGPSIYAQNGSLTGQILDENDEAMAFAHILLLHQKDSTLVKGVTSDEEGRFSIEGIPSVSYLLHISLLGYEPYFKEVSSKDAQENLMGTINLVPQSQKLQGVEVVGRKKLFEQKVDRLIVNVGSLPTFSGNNALQVLQKAPGVIVQEDQNSISLNNKGEVLLMINDRVSRIPPGALIQRLKGMRAENIDRIEIIHQPSSKYDADNAAGIIHIVLKENDKYGLSGNASLTIGIGQREKFNGSTDLNYRDNSLNLYGNVTEFQSKSPMSQVKHFREYEYLGDQYFYENKLRFTDPTNYSLAFTLGADYEIDKDHIIGALIGYTRSNTFGRDFTSKSLGTINGIMDTDLQFLLDIDNPNYYTFANVNYLWKLTPKSSLNVDLDRVSLDVENSSLLTYLNPDDAIDATESNRVSSFEIYTVKGDYEWKTEDGSKVETGLKGTFNNSNTVSQIHNQGGGARFEDESFRTNDNINETILAAYASFQKKWNDKWESNLGARLENYKYNLDDTVRDNDFTVNYTNLFPIVRTTFIIDSTKTLTLSLNRRIERPAFASLAGFHLLIDPSLFVSSNTRIRPAFNNAARLAYNVNSFILSLEVSRTQGAISFYNTVDKERGLQTSTPINFDRMNSFLISMGFPIKIGKTWKMNWNLDGSYNSVEDVSNRPLPFKNAVFTVTAQLVNVFELGKSWTVNIDGRYKSPYITGDQIQYLRHYINLGISKKFSNASTITFNVQDLTVTGGLKDWEYNQPELGIKTFGQNDFSERVFQLTYTFPFGNQRVKQKRNRKTGSQEVRDRM